jgi:hypothetical protein
MQGNQDKDTSTDEVQSTEREQKNAAGTWMFFCCECCVLQVEASATGRSLVQGNLTERDCHCVIEIKNNPSERCWAKKERR